MVAGVVQTVTPYDAHVDLGGGVSGVLHAREVSSVAVEDPRAVLREGDGVTALVTRVNAKAGLVTLSTRLLEPSPGKGKGDTCANADLPTLVAQATVYLPSPITMHGH